MTKIDCQEIKDEELVKKSLKNIDFFACIYERYEKKLISYILRISSFSYNEAEEVLQESFVKVKEFIKENKYAVLKNGVWEIVASKTIPKNVE